VASEIVPDTRHRAVLDVERPQRLGFEPRSAGQHDECD
jgi:hypothetical protein